MYHVLEDEVASLADPEVYEAQVGLMKVALDAEAICSTIRRIRDEAAAE